MTSTGISSFISCRSPKKYVLQLPFYRFEKWDPEYVKYFVRRAPSYGLYVWMLGVNFQVASPVFPTMPSASPSSLCVLAIVLLRDLLRVYVYPYVCDPVEKDNVYVYSYISVSSLWWQAQGFPLCRLSSFPLLAIILLPDLLRVYVYPYRDARRDCEAERCQNKTLRKSTVMFYNHACYVTTPLCLYA